MSSIFSQVDFIEYHTAFQLFIDLKNPYDAKELLLLQQALGKNSNIPLMMWNPPWLLVLLSPVLSLPFEVANVVWLLLNILFLCGAVYLYFRAEGRTLSAKIPLLISIIFLFYPFINCILLGQLGCYFAIVLSILYYGLKKDKDYLVGISWFLLSVKPHIFIFLSFYLLFVSIKSHRYQILLYAVLSTVFITSLTYLINPHALYSWLEVHTVGTNLKDVIRVDQHKTTTIVYALRTLIDRAGYGVQHWPFFVVPGLPLIFYSLHLYRSSYRSLLESKAFNLSLILSFLFSPFGWIFDFVPLIFVCIEILDSKKAFYSFRYWKNPVVLSYVFLNLLCFIIDSFPFIGLHHYVFYVPFVIGMTIVWDSHIKETQLTL